MPRHPDLPCASCGKLLWRGRNSLPEGKATCQSCRHSYRTGCRCDDCRADQASRMREYSRSYRERTGESLRGRFADARRKWISPNSRLAVYERDAWMCHLCETATDRDADTNSDFAPSLDHLVPRVLGGGDEPENLKCAHRICNAARGAKELSL